MHVLWNQAGNIEWPLYLQNRQRFRYMMEMALCFGETSCAGVMCMAK